MKIKEKNTVLLLEEFGVKIIDQEKRDLPLVWSNDIMTITAPSEIPIYT